jgi:hypothetical protein
MSAQLRDVMRVEMDARVEVEPFRGSIRPAIRVTLTRSAGRLSKELIVRRMKGTKEACRFPPSVRCRDACDGRRGDVERAGDVRHVLLSTVRR